MEVTNHAEKEAMDVFEHKTYKNVNFGDRGFIKGTYENCTFTNCVFPGSDLSNFIFSDCDFLGCDASLAKIGKTAFRADRFRECKLLGMHFEQCNPFLFSADFEKCILNLSSFYKLSLKKIRFKDCSLHEVDFTESDLSSSLFDNCDLTKAIFQRTTLFKADFRTSYNYSINPETNRIKKAKFSIAGVAGLLDKYDIEIG